MGDDNHRKNEVYSNRVRAGKRTYFFDVKETYNHDLYIVVTESKKNWRDDGSHFFQKSKLFLYKEDFENFESALQETFGEIEKLRETGNYTDESPMDRIGSKENENGDQFNSVEEPSVSHDSDYNVI